MSPLAPLRPCLAPGCSAQVRSGRCPSHTQARERQRGTPYARGYDRRWAWHRHQYLSTLVALGILPVCGARLPGAPRTDDSLCAAEHVLVGDVDVDHIQPHRGQSDPLFWDTQNFQLLCHARCHPQKTVLKDGGFGRAARVRIAVHP
jgi:5-methylcytosine-specific restriction protein A